MDAGSYDEPTVILCRGHDSHEEPMGLTRLEDARFSLTLTEDGTILLVDRNKDFNEIRIIDNSTLRTHLKPITDQAYVLVKAIPPLLTHPLPGPSTSLRQQQGDGIVREDKLAVHESPLSRGTYRIWVYASKSRFPRSPDPDWFLNRTKSPNLLCGLTFSRHETVFHEIAYSGHMLCMVKTSRGGFVVPPTGASPGELRDIQLEPDPDDRSSPHITPYSGAVTFASRDTVVVQYFR
ncbi:hypothetical protein FB45DRAFT_1032647 [Roridomyces roridus]|uniref:Uncharacterized protein n=1 Tax=Roridomyces roridus TaxID=1738132 RepID=A0AAD7BI75_9AGAR|nr:hypothetical protein FB45DRAFT_1032647 [Roridomyces roridus]